MPLLCPFLKNKLYPPLPPPFKAIHLYLDDNMVYRKSHGLETSHKLSY